MCSTIHGSSRGHAVFPRPDRGDAFDAAGDHRRRAVDDDAAGRHRDGLQTGRAEAVTVVPAIDSGKPERITA